MNPLLFFVILLSSVYGFCYCGKSKIHIYFANGMFNSKAEAVKSYKELAKQKIIHSGSDFEIVYSTDYVAYNTDESLLNQLFEVARQKSKDTDSNFWGYLGSFELAPEWFQKMSAEIQRGIAFDEFFQNKDLQKQIYGYSRLLETPDNHILTVAHSQGNFFTNFAFKALSSPNTKFRMKMISVATPAGEVYQYGPHLNLKSDCVVNRMPGALPTNIENSPAGFCDHEFVKNYLNGGDSGYRFASYFEDEITQSGGLSDWVKFPTDGMSLIRWLARFDPSKYKKILLPHQCLAIRMMHGMHDRRWTSVKCEDRGRSGFISALNDCLTKDKAGPIIDSNCPVMFGLTHDTASGIIEEFSYEANMNDRFNTHSECNWYKDKFLEEDLSQEMIEKAVKFYDNPWAEIPLTSENSDRGN